MTKPEPWTQDAQDAHDSRMEWDEKPTLPCGCELGEGIQGYGDFYIVYCPTHKAARDLLKAAKAALEYMGRWNAGVVEQGMLRAAIKKARGE